VFWTSAIIGQACGLWLAWTDPALSHERLARTFQDTASPRDKEIHADISSL